jgi:hypothetical protein
MPTPTKYELYHSANIAAIEKQLLQLYDSADFEILAFVRATFRDNPNYVNTPLFQSKLADIQRKLHDNILSSIGTGVQNADLISALKSKDYIASLFRNKKAYEIVVAKEFKTTSGAATAILC